MAEKTKFQAELVVNQMGDTAMRVSYTDPNGLLVEKIISIEDYISIFASSAYLPTASMVRIGQLPEGYFDGCISQAEIGTFSAIVIRPAEKRAMTYGGRHWYVPFPKLCFFFSVRQGVLYEKSCYALMDEPVTENTVLKCYPFGNVSCYGAICMGNIDCGDISSLKKLDSVVENFFLGETNNDYYSDTGGKTGLTQAQMLGKLKKLEGFPAEWLIDTAGDDKTIGDLMKKLR